MLNNILVAFAVLCANTEAIPRWPLVPRQEYLPQTILTCPPCKNPSYTTPSLSTVTATGVPGDVIGGTTAINNGAAPVPTAYSTYTVCTASCTVNGGAYGPGTVFYPVSTFIPPSGTITFGGQTLTAPTAVVTIVVDITVNINVVVPTINPNVVVIAPTNTNGGQVGGNPTSLPPLSMSFPTGTANSGAVGGASTTNSGTSPSGGVVAPPTASQIAANTCTNTRACVVGTCANIGADPILGLTTGVCIGGTSTVCTGNTPCTVGVCLNTSGLPIMSSEVGLCVSSPIPVGGIIGSLIGNIPTTLPTLPINLPTTLPTLPINLPTTLPTLPINLPTTLPTLPINLPTTLPTLPVNLPTTLPTLPVELPTTLPTLPVELPTTLPVQLPTTSLPITLPTLPVVGGALP